MGSLSACFFSFKTTQSQSTVSDGSDPEAGNGVQVLGAGATAAAAIDVLEHMDVNNLGMD